MTSHAEDSEELMLARNRVLSAFCLVTALVSLDACYGRGPLELTLTVSGGRPSRSYHTGIGQQLLDTVTTPSGGGVQYASTPALTGSSVAFVGESCAPQPSGTCAQIFQFTGIAAGQTIVTFQSVSNPSADVVDTVIVH
jgi:hypothetical protein